MPLAYDGSWGNKHPDAKRIFELDWSGNLDPNVTVSGSEWAIVQGSVVLESSGGEFDNTSTKCTLSGGVDLETCLIKNSVTLSNGGLDECTMRLDIRTS